MKSGQESPVMVGTSTLLQRVFQASSLRSFLDENRSSLTMPTFPEYLEQLCGTRNVVREHVILRAGIERSFGHQLFRGVRKPSRDNVLRLAIGFGLNVEEAQTLLRMARKTALYPRIMRDAVIISSLAHHHTIIEVQCLLNDLGMTELGDERYECAGR